MKTIISSALLVMLFSSCSKELLDRVPGNWTYTETGTITVSSATINSTDSIAKGGAATFNEDGTGLIIINSDTTNLLWEASLDTIKLVIDNVSENYQVIENSKSRQEWKTTSVETGDTYSLTTEKTILLTQ